MKVYLGDRTVELLKQVLFRNLCKLDLINHYLLIIPRAKRSDKEHYSIDDEIAILFLIRIERITLQDS